jgi:replication factor C subunit 3/5
MRIPKPSTHDIINTVLMASMRENYDISLGELAHIVKHSKNDVNTCLWCLELIMNDIDLDDSTDSTIHKIYELILLADLSNIQKIRTLIYNILITNIDGKILIEKILEKICMNKHLSDNIKYKIVKLASRYDHYLAIGRRDIIHLDGFFVSVMALFIDHIHQDIIQ